MNRDSLDAYPDQYLEVPKFRDYCRNGLQVEGRADVRRMVSGVTGSFAFLEVEAAVADAALVHHGYFWRGADARLTAARRRPFALILEHNLDFFAFHLPLDAHPAFGSNVELARCFGIEHRFTDIPNPV